MTSELERLLTEVEGEPRFRRRYREQEFLRMIVKLKNPRDHKMYIDYIRRWDRATKYKYPKK